MHTYVLVCVLSILSASVVEGSLEKKSGGNRTVELLIVSNIDCLTPKPKKFFLQSFLNFFSHPCPTCLQLAAEQIPENFCCCINTDRYIYVIYLFHNSSRLLLELSLHSPRQTKKAKFWCWAMNHQFSGSARLIINSAWVRLVLLEIMFSCLSEDLPILLKGSRLR